MGRVWDKPGGRWLLLACLIYGGLLLWNPPCLFAAFLGVPCPGCGMRRALLAAWALDFGGAFHWHPMFWSLPVLAVSIWKDGRLTGSRRANLAIHGVIALGFGVHYAAVLLRNL